MRHVALLLAFLPGIIASANVICTNGYSLVNNKCLRLFTGPMVHKDAVATCSAYAGTLVTIKNAIDNRAITSFVGSTIKHTWIGLFCFQNDPTNCYWDDESGTSADYSSFARSFPYTDVGNCVYYSVSGTLAGQWVSGDCDDDLRPFVCEMPSTYQDYSCNYNFNGNCYFSSYDMRYSPLSFTNAQNQCESLCGNLVSIHSANDMRFLKNYYYTRSTDSIYIGAITVSGKYNSWTDGTAWDYNNIDNSQSWASSSNCMMVPLGNNGTLTNDAWYHTNCDTARPFMCKRKTGTECGSDYSTTTTDSYFSASPNPSDSTPTCTSFLMSSGTFSSPGYPGNYTNNLNCAYTLATLGAYRIRLSFNSFVTESCCDRVRIYDGDSADSRLIAQLNGIQNTPLYYESTGNMLYVTFTTDGSVVAQGFTANFLSLI